MNLDNNTNSNSKTKEENAAYYVKEIVDYLRENQYLSEDLELQISTGEITINPYKDVYYEIAKNYRTLFFTNGFIFDQQIADIIKSNTSLVQCDIDAGTRETYKKVKGFDKFDTVISNMREYIKYSHRVRIKYIMLPEINDSDEDFNGIVKVLKDLDRKWLWIGKNWGEEDMDRSCRSIALLLHYLHSNKITHGFVYPFSGDELDLIKNYYFGVIQDDRISEYMKNNGG